MEKLLDSWRKRYLTLSGKVCILNSLALSTLYYCASILNFPNSENVKTINRLTNFQLYMGITRYNKQKYFNWET